MSTTQLFEATVEHLPRVSIINLSGRIDASAQEQLAAAYTAIVGASSSGLILDFQHVQYMNSSGIALIIGIIARANQARRRVAVVSLTEHYQRIFEVTRLADFVSIAPDRASALALLLQDAGEEKAGLRHLSHAPISQEER